MSISGFTPRHWIKQDIRRSISVTFSESIKDFRSYRIVHASLHIANTQTLMVYYSSCNRKKSAMSMRRMLEQVVSTTCIQCCHPAAQVLVLVLQNGLALLRVHRRIHVLLRSVPLCLCLSVCLMVTPQSFCNGGAIRHLLVTGHFGPETVRRWVRSVRTFSHQCRHWGRSISSPNCLGSDVSVSPSASGFVDDVVFAHYGHAVSGRRML